MAKPLHDLVEESKDQKLKRVRIKHAFPSPEIGKNVFTVVVAKHVAQFIGHVIPIQKDYDPQPGDNCDIRLKIGEKEEDGVTNMVIMRTAWDDEPHKKKVEKKKAMKSTKTK